MTLVKQINYMKYLTLLLIISLSNCANNKNTFIQKEDKKKTDWCPDNGMCHFKILENSSLILKTDEFGNGYHKIIESTNTVLQFEFTKNSDSTLQDSSYTEMVLIELTDLDNTFTAKDLNLRKYNAIYNRLCFCRGQTGSYALTNGILEFNVTNSKKHVKFTFKNEKIPQLLTFVEASF
jgi:hypothetical protein